MIKHGIVCFMLVFTPPLPFFIGLLVLSLCSHILELLLLTDIRCPPTASPLNRDKATPQAASGIYREGTITAFPKCAFTIVAATLFLVRIDSNSFFHALSYDVNEHKFHEPIRYRMTMGAAGGVV